MKIKKMIMLAAVGMSSLAAPVNGIASSQVVSTADQRIVKKISYTTQNNADARKDENVKIRVDFSEDFRNHQIKPGDKLVFTLPTQLKGVNKTIPLEQDQKGIFGSVVITNGQAVLEFNEKVKAYDHIHGFFEIGTRVIADITPGSSVQVPMNLGTSVHVQSLKITNPVGGDNPNPLSYKVGTQDIDDPEHIKWFINLNSTNARIQSDMVITDTVGKGHKLEMDLLRFHDGHFTEKNYKQAVVDGDMTVDYINETGFKLTIKQSKAGGTLKYTTKIDANAHKQKEMPNYFKVQANAEGHRESVWEGNRSVKNILALEGGIDGDQEEHHATDGIQDMPEENVDDIKDVEEGHVNGSNVKDETNKLDNTKPRVENGVNVQEETLPEENVEGIKDIEEGIVTESDIQDETHKSEKLPLIENNGDVIEEITPEEQLEIIEEIIEEHTDVNEIGDETHKVEELPLIENNGEEVEEVTPEEQLEIIEEIIEEHTDVNEIKDETNKIEDNTPWIEHHIDVIEEVVPVEEVEIIDPMKPAPKHNVKPTPTPDVKPMPAPKPDVKPTPAPKQEVKPTPENKVVDTKKKSELPNTGYKNDNILIWFGLVALLAAAAWLFKKSKTRK
ncbi:Ig-like domain-containing protein [Weissella ceti]|uniref:Ig-like domain-containing protein n=1 Tax=Weissella ceti TaxID=759620 RepID=A0ABT3E368_9LACO|nr:collagen binding domain-containing protein [Weissella ceti]MCW0952842.1 Ig-like domain-containing protein [Weissella ceti]QVK12539.1 LPXTG cell wall anchor domain-containing protein [Weissella ceti]